MKVTEESTLLFYNVDGRRQPLRVRNGKFTAGRASFSLAELQAAIKKTPELFTPNVLLRPIVQDTLLPTAAYIGGAAEIAYMAQAQVVYDKLLGRMPAILSRAGFTIIEPFVARLLTKFGLDISDVFRGHQHLRARMEQKALPRALASRFDAGEKNAAEAVEKLSSSTHAAGPHVGWRAGFCGKQNAPSICEVERESGPGREFADRRARSIRTDIA